MMCQNCNRPIRMHHSSPTPVWVHYDGFSICLVEGITTWAHPMENGDGERG